MEQLTTGTASARPAWEVRSGQPVAPASQADRGIKSPSDTAVRAPQKVSSQGLREQVEEIERLRAEVSTNLPNRLQIERDQEGGRFIYRFMDQDTGEQVKQWPPESYLELIAYLRESQAGLVDERA